MPAHPPSCLNSLLRLLEGWGKVQAREAVHALKGQDHACGCLTEEESTETVALLTAYIGEGEWCRFETCVR